MGARGFCSVGFFILKTEGKDEVNEVSGPSSPGIVWGGKPLRVQAASARIMGLRPGGGQQGRSGRDALLESQASKVQACPQQRASLSLIEPGWHHD